MFFSVKTSVKIAGKVYIPCVCYALPDFLKPTVEKMVKEEKAYIYDHKVAFQNGKVIEKKEPQPVTVEKPKKAKKEKVVEEVKEEEKEIPSPEEVADNVEDF